MSKDTALCLLLRGLGYDSQRAAQLEQLLDEQAPEGMKGDDIAARLLEWRVMQKPLSKCFRKALRVAAAKRQGLIELVARAQVQQLHDDVVAALEGQDIPGQLTMPF